jgi:hypothetical protein
MSRSPRNPVFVPGYPRSGTTLLRAILGAHSEIHMVNEPELIRGMLASGRRLTETIRLEEVPLLLDELQQVGTCREHLLTLPAEKISELMDGPNELDLRDVYEQLLPKPDDILYWGEKSLGNVFYIHELLELYSRAVFVFIVRDPRAVLLSLYRKKFAKCAKSQPILNNESVRFFMYNSLMWKQWLDAVREARKTLGKRIVFQLRFRDLVTSPERGAAYL